MSERQAREFIGKLLHEKPLRKQLENELNLGDGNNDTIDREDLRQRMVEIVPDFAAEHGYEFNAEEGFAAFQVYWNRQQSDELSDDELEKVAGGTSKQTKDIAAASSALTVGLTCAMLSIGLAADGDSSCSDAFPDVDTHTEVHY